MNEKRFRYVVELFDIAVRLEPAQRAAYLDEACSDDADLRREVEALLVHDHAPAAAVRTPPFADDVRIAVDRAVAEVSPPGTPDGTTDSGDDPEQVGPYRLIRRIGEGGMGVVFLAEQSEPVRRQVALKLVKAGMDTRQVVARFESERQALALMNHPHVAKVHDGGETEQGRPFFVMEYVPGIPMTHYCDAQRLTVHERLALFTKVCLAVQHAHQKGIIHRDIKPSNVLVTIEDGKAIPKVIDFGIAKAVSQPLTDRTLHTEQGQLIGTPEYMSPEQADMTPLGVDTRSDVYSLGVLLYELLAGVLPFDREVLRSAGFAEVQRIIREVDPPKPSTRFTSLLMQRHKGPSAADIHPTRDAAAPPTPTAPGKAEAASTCLIVAHRRRLTPRSLARELRGDLDWITMRALEKDRTRRYGSASELAADIGRYLTNEPVLAGPPSTMYRVRKFVKRNRTAVAVLAAFAIVVTIGAAGTVWYAVESKRSAACAERRQSAILNLIDLVDAKDPRLEIIASAYQLKALEDTKERLETDLFDSPCTLARSLRFIGGLELRYGAHRKAMATLDHALHLAVGGCGPSDLEVAEVLTLLGEVQLELRDEDYDDAERLLSEARVIYERHGTGAGTGYPDCLNNLGEALASLRPQDLGQAEAVYVAAHDANRTLLGYEDPRTLDSRQGLAYVAYLQGDHAKAVGLLREVVDRKREVLGPTHEQVAEAVNDLAVILGGMGEEEQAEARQLLQQNLQTLRHTFGERHPRVGAALCNIGTVYYNIGDTAKSLSAYRESVDILRAKLGTPHPRTIQSLTGLATTLTTLRRYAEAEPLFRELVEIQTHRLGEAHPHTLQNMNNLAHVLDWQGKLREAEEVCRNLLKLRRRHQGSDVWITQIVVNRLGSLLVKQHRYGDAEPFVREYLDHLRRTRGDEHAWTISQHARLAALLRELERVEEAAVAYEASLDLRREHQPDQRGMLADLLLEYGEFLVEVDRSRQAEPLIREALELRREGDMGAPTIAEAESLLGYCLARLGRYAEVEPLLTSGYETLRDERGEDARETIRALERLIAFYKASGRPNEADRYRAYLDTPIGP